jgi:hypothetical protein
VWVRGRDRGSILLSLYVFRIEIEISLIMFYRRLKRFWDHASAGLDVYLKRGIIILCIPG